MRNLIKIIICLSFLNSHITFADLDLHSKSNAILSPSEVIRDLQQGNKRFLENKLHYRNYQQEIRKTAAAQFPEAVVLSCMDSRNIPELTFDQGIGDILAVRVGGNIVNDDILGSLEYATTVTHTSVIVVMGHTACGAIKGTCNNVQLGHLTQLVQKIQPAVLQAKKEMPNGRCDDPEFINTIARHNVLNVMKQIPKKSPIIADLIAKGKVTIVGGLYDIETGKVTLTRD